MLKQKINIEKSNIIQRIGEIYCLILLFLPNNIIEATSVYTVLSPSQIRYEYTSFYFSFLLIPAIVWAIIIRKKTHAIQFHLIIIGIIIKDIIFLTFFKNKQEIDYSYSFNLILLSAWSITAVIFNYTENDDTKSAENFFDIYFILSFLSQLLRFVLGLSTQGRYGAIGLSVGGTGYLDSLFIVYCLYYRVFSGRVATLLIIAFLSLILSGQRTNILFLFTFLVLFFIKTLFEKRTLLKDRGKIFFLGVSFEFLIVSLAAIILSNELIADITGLQFISRILEAAEKFFNGTIETEYSVEGRFLSLDAGFEVLKTNPWGILNDFYDLQYRMLQNNYPTFPHNALLCCYLLWSPVITLFCFIYLAKLLIDARKANTGMVWPLLYIFLYNIITGSVFLSYPYLVISLFFISLTKCKVVQYNSEGWKTNGFNEDITE